MTTVIRLNDDEYHIKEPLSSYFVFIKNCSIIFVLEAKVESIV